MSYNKIIIEGNLGRDAECRQLSGTNVISFTVAVTERWNKDGQDQEHTDWFDCDLFCKTDGLLKVLTKGTRVLVDGPMRSRKYEKDGQTRVAWAIRVDRLDLLGSKPQEQQPQQQQPVSQTIVQSEGVQQLAATFGAQEPGLPF